MFDKLEVFEKRYNEINQKLYDPNVISDQNAYKNLMKEHKNLTPIVEKYREYKKAKNSEEEARQLLNEGGLEKDFKETIVNIKSEIINTKTQIDIRKEGE